MISYAKHTSTKSQRPIRIFLTTNQIYMWERERTVEVIFINVNNIKAKNMKVTKPLSFQKTDNTKNYLQVQNLTNKIAALIYTYTHPQPLK